MQHWTSEEIEILKNNCSDNDLKMLQKKLPKYSIMAIKFKAVRLKIKIRKIELPWTKWRIEKLKELYSYTPNYKLINILGISIEGINKKAQRLGLKKSSDYKHTYMVKRIGWCGDIKNQCHNIPNYIYKSHTPSSETKEKNRNALFEYFRRMRETKRGRNILERRNKKAVTNRTYSRRKFKIIVTEKNRSSMLKNLEKANAANNLKYRSRNILKELRKYQN